MSNLWQILITHQYVPEKHIEKNDKGILVPTNLCPQKLLDDILQYSKDRNEDDFYKFFTNSLNKIPISSSLNACLYKPSFCKDLDIS